MFDAVVWRHRGKKIAPKTVTQKAYVDAIRRSTVTFGIGPAGTGKTYLAMALAVAALHEREVGADHPHAARRRGRRAARVPAGRPAGEGRPVPAPAVRRALRHARPRQGEHLMERGTIEVAPLAFMRGRTLNDSFIILDEAQNTSPEQMQMFLTRLGFGSKVVVTGDVTQIDLPREQALRPRPRAGRPRRRSTASRSSSSATRTSCGTSSCSGSSRPTRSTRTRPEPDDRGRGREPERRRRSTSRARSSSRAACCAPRASRRASSGSRSSGRTRCATLKREHLGIDEATDVLSFPIDGRDELPEGVPRALGDVVLCPQVVGEEWRWPLDARAAAPARLRPRRRDGSARGGAARDELRAPRADDLRLVQLRVRGDHPRAPHAAEHADPLRVAFVVLVARADRQRDEARADRAAHLDHVRADRRDAEHRRSRRRSTSRRRRSTRWRSSRRTSPPAPC